MRRIHLSLLIVMRHSRRVTAEPRPQDGARCDVLVMGAGSVGCWVGGRLAASGAAVHFVGRARVLGALRSRGLTLTDLDGGHTVVAAGGFSVADAVAPGPRPALVLLCVKSAATADAARQLGAVLPAGTPVLSLQNGVANAAAGAAAAPALHWLAGMVPFNVAELGPGHFHRGTGGALAAQDDPALRAWQPRFAAAALPLVLHADLAPVLWGKLLLNLNNPVNALSGLPLRAQLLDRGYRRCTAALISEALAALAAAGIVPAKVGAAPPRLLPWLLRLPTPLFRRAAARLLKIDAKARSSMADDLALGRATEVDAFCGEVVRLARAHGTNAQRNARMVELVQGWAADARPRPAAELVRLLDLG
jgi:2-dehydropantoate 2-reductase